MKYVIIEETDTTVRVRVFDGETVKDKNIDLTGLKSQELAKAEFIENDINNTSEKDWELVETKTKEEDLTEAGVAVAPVIKE